MRTTINVTPYYIKKGVKDDPQDCPIGCVLASRVLKQGLDYEVDVDEVIIEATSLELPRKAANFINRFDNGKGAKPFTFTLNIPDRYLRPSAVRRIATQRAAMRAAKVR